MDKFKINVQYEGKNETLDVIVVDGTDKFDVYNDTSVIGTFWPVIQHYGVHWYSDNENIASDQIRLIGEAIEHNQL
jgi:hypothetical protein